MSKTKSGLTLIAIGIGIYQADQMLASPLMGLVAFASMVVGLFGLFRLIVGLLSPKKQTKAGSEMPPSEGVWPPAPKPPGAA